MRVTKDTTILEALQIHEKAKEIFVRHGMGCIGCMGAMNESIGSGALMHDVDVDLLIEELNELIGEK